ncbi:PilZ domain-containing protein [uncultured Sphingomonas sp.]|uniref:PilZ domain-containing protein n=1 Tax=uncultured Sphingomonas sp. TaxID=158754 RepID=UPI0035CC3315
MATRVETHFAERREEARNKSVLALGKIVSGGQEHICMVRDISDSGLKIEMPDPPGTGCYVIVEMLGLNPCAACVVWRLDHHAGLAFSVPQDIDRMCKRGRDAMGITARGPRFTINRKAELCIDRKRLRVEVANISVGGVRLRGMTGVPSNRPAQLTLGTSPSPLSGHVRWVADDDAGFSFAPALDIQKLLKEVAG